VLPLLVQGGRVLEQPDVPVHPRPQEAVPPQALEHLAVLPLAAADHRGQQHQLRPGWQLLQVVDDLLGALFGDRPAAAVAVLDPDPREEHAQVVVDLGDGADGGPRIGPGRPLVDGDGGGQAVDGFVARLLHLAEELAGVARERLDIAPLPLGEQGVEGEARLARAADAGEHHQPFLGYFHPDVFEVVLGGARDDDPVELAGHLWKKLSSSRIR